MRSLHHLFKRLEKCGAIAILLIICQSITPSAWAAIPVATKDSIGNTPEKSPSLCQHSLNQPIALVIDRSGHLNGSKQNYQPELLYGSLESFSQDKIILLVPKGQLLSAADQKALHSKSWGGRFFRFLLLPAIAQEVIENYLQRNTTPLLGETFNNSGDVQVRTIAREICLDLTFGLGAAWGVCDFFGGLIDAVIDRVREYYRTQE